MFDGASDIFECILNRFDGFLKRLILAGGGSGSGHRQVSGCEHHEEDEDPALESTPWHPRCPSKVSLRAHYSLTIRVCEIFDRRLHVLVMAGTLIDASRQLSQLQVSRFSVISFGVDLFLVDVVVVEHFSNGHPSQLSGAF